MRKACRILLTLTVCLILTASGQTTRVLKFREGIVWVTGLGATLTPEAEWATGFRVYTQEAWIKKIDQPVAGTYIRHTDSLSFRPNFNFVAGGNYHAVFGKLELFFSVPGKKSSSTFVEAIHPQADVLPENMLRMYLSFSSPMMPGEAYDHIALLRDNGTPIEKAFLVIDQELWDPERKRLTLLFDPGRVKRGIQSNVEMGAPLQAGQTYRLVIDTMWRDDQGNALAHGYTKTFSVTAAERTKLNIQQWKVTAPTIGTLDDLFIEFDRPIDYALALKYISISAAQTGRVNGHTVLTGSNVWRFTPHQPWREDQYFIEAHPQLEDVAGNNLNNVFDIDLSKESRVNATKILKRSFSIRPLMK
jgi:hypothetical protein